MHLQFSLLLTKYTILFMCVWAYRISWELCVCICVCVFCVYSSVLSPLACSRKLQHLYCGRTLIGLIYLHAQTRVVSPLCSFPRQDVCTAYIIACKYINQFVHCSAAHQIQIQTKKIDLSHITSKCGSMSNLSHRPGTTHTFPQRTLTPAVNIPSYLSGDLQHIENIFWRTLIIANDEKLILMSVPIFNIWLCITSLTLSRAYCRII